MRLTVPERERMTMESVTAPSREIRTPSRRAPSVTPVAATKTSSPATKSSVCSTRSRSYPASTSAERSSSFRGQSFPCTPPPRHLTAAAAMTPSGVPPMPIIRSTEEPCRAAAIAGATSPSVMMLTFAPASRRPAIRSAFRSRSRTTTVMSVGFAPFAAAARSTFSCGEAVMSTTSATSGPAAILSMYKAAPGKNIVPRSATAMTAIAFGWPTDVRRVPSSGSTATSTSGELPLPTSSPLKSIGALSFSPSPMTTTPFIETVSSIERIASTAAWSAASLSPRPTHRAQLSAADSVTRTSSSARFRSGATPFPPAMAGNLHPFGRFDPHQLESAGDDEGCRAAERETKRLLVALQYAMVVVEAVEVVRNADRVGRQGVGPATLGRLLDDGRKLREPLDELALFRSEGARRRRESLASVGVPEDARNARVRVLHVVDGILVGPLPGEVDVDLHRLLVPAGEEVPPGGVDADLVQEVVEKDDVAAPLRHFPRFAGLGELDELVDQHFDGGGIVPEGAGDRLQARNVAVVVGAQHVDETVVAAV